MPRPLLLPRCLEPPPPLSCSSLLCLRTPPLRAGGVIEYKYVLLDHGGHHAVAWQVGTRHTHPPHEGHTRRAWAWVLLCADAAAQASVAAPAAHVRCGGACLPAVALRAAAPACGAWTYLRCASARSPLAACAPNSPPEVPPACCRRATTLCLPSVVTMIWWRCLTTGESAAWHGSAGGWQDQHHQAGWQQQCHQAALQRGPGGLLLK